MSVPDSHYTTPDRTEGKWYDMKRGQKGWFAIWFALGAITILLPMMLPFKLLGVLSVLFGAWGAWWGSDGPNYQDLLDRLDSRKREKKSGGYVDPVDTGADHKVSVPFDFGLGGLYFPTEEGVSDSVFPTGLLFDYDNNLCTFYFVTEGWDAHSKDWADRKLREKDFVDVLSKAVVQVDPEHEKVSVTLLNGSRPWSALPTIANLSRQLHPDFKSPPKGTTEDGLSENLNLRIRKIAVVGAHHVNAVAVTTRVPQAWIKKKFKLNNIDAEEAAASHIKEALLEGLRAIGVHNPRCLDILELDEFIQTQWNIAKAGELNRRLFVRRWKLATGELTPEQVIEELRKTNPFPKQNIRLGKDYLFVDGTYLRVYRTFKFARKSFAPGALVPMFMNPGSPWLMSALGGDIYSAIAEMARMTRAIVFQRGWRKQKDTSDIYYSKLERDEHGRTERQQTAIYESQAPVFKFNHFTTVGATNKKELRKFSRKARAGALQMLIMLMPVRHQSRQLRAFANAILGVNIL